MKNHKKMALDNFASGYNCAQSVFAAFAADYGINTDQAYKLACGVGGGFRFAEVCGAVSGATMIIGLKCGNQDSKDLPCRDHCYAQTIAFIKAFKQRNHDAMTCKDLLGFNLMTPEGQKYAMQNMTVVKAKCINAISTAVELLEEMGY